LHPFGAQRNAGGSFRSMRFGSLRSTRPKPVGVAMAIFPSRRNGSAKARPNGSSTFFPVATSTTVITSAWTSAVFASRERSTAPAIARPSPS
jgi:hypothetical protein